MSRNNVQKLSYFSFVKIFVAIALQLLITIASAKTTTAIVSGGNWTTVGTWDNGLPASGDVVIIPAGITVNVNSTVNLRGAATTTINVSGTLSLFFGANIRINSADGDAVNVLSGGTISAGDLLGGIISFGTNPILLYAPYVSISSFGVFESASGNFTPGPLIGPAIISAGVLPIVLLSFDAIAQEDHVAIVWTTASEENNNFFTVERSADGEQFELVEEVPGRGTSYSQVSYQVLDRTPLIGRNYYRLKQTDFDGSYSYGPVVKADFERSGAPVIKAFPSPLDRNPLSIQIEPLSPGVQVTIKLISSHGQVLREETYAADSTGRINCVWELEDLATGLYVLKAGGTLLLTQKVIIR
jgi:hypothetical protein